MHQQEEPHFRKHRKLLSNLEVSANKGTIPSKINVTPKCGYLPISKLHSILAVANLLAHNNKSQICYCGQISLHSAAADCSFSDTFGGNIYFAGEGTLTCVMLL